jgi:low affinity Fe/Cu permease
MRDDRRASAAEWVGLIAFFILAWVVIVLLGFALVKALS